MIKLQIKNNTGFTLVETLVAISIFTVSVLGLLSILSSGIASTSLIRNKIVASYLAQESVEYVRNIRDSAVLYAATPQEGWDQFYNNVVSTCGGNGCYLSDPDLLILTSCGTNCPHMLYQPTTGGYNYIPGGVDSGFTNKITVQSYVGEGEIGDEIKVSAEISWDQGIGTQTVKFTDNLLNWIE